MNKSAGRVVSIVALTLASVIGCDGPSTNQEPVERFSQGDPGSVAGDHQTLAMPPEEAGHGSQQVLALDIDPKQEAFPADESLLDIGSWTLDRSAYVGLPRCLADNATAYVSEVLQVVGLDKGPQRIKYERVDRHNGGAIFPLDVVFRETGTEAVPIVILPSPKLLRGVQEWAVLRDWDDVRGLETLESLDWDKPSIGMVGRTVFFAPGPSSESPIRTPPLPYGARLSSGIFKHAPPHLKMGKIVMSARDRNVAETLEPLKLGKQSGATLIGRLTTIPFSAENERLRLVQLDVPDKKQTRSWIACALSDANGARRGKSFVQPDGTSSFERPLTSPSHDPRVGRHSLLRIPGPLDLHSRIPPHEEIAIDEWFFRSGAPGVVLAAEADSAPFRESLLLVTEPAELSSGDRPLLVATFLGAPPLDTVRFMQTLSLSAPGEAKLEDEVMAQLEHLHKVLVPEGQDE